MSKRFASDEPDEVQPEEGQEANITTRDKPQDLPGSALEDSTLARLYKTEKIAERFVGRAEEMEKLRGWFNLSLEGQGKPIFIVGDPGIGKTELVRQFFTDLQKVDKISLNGRYFDVGSGAPYKVFLDGLYELAGHLERNVFQGDSPLSVAEVKSLQTCLKEIREISSLSMIQGQEADRIKYHTFDLLAQSYRLLTPVRPVTLFLDDLQWADELSLEFLAYVIRALKGERFFIICTVREQEIALEGNPLRTWMRRMSRYNAYEQLKLLPLSETETESLIELLFNKHALTESDIKLLHRETGGNPYYLLEIIKQLIEDHKIFFKEGYWSCSGLDDVRLPKSLIDLVELQLGRLDQETLDIFEKAAVIGEEFSFTLLQAVTGLDEEKLTDAIEKGLREFLIREEPRSLAGNSENYTFCYNTTRKVLYESLTSRQRRVFHMKAARFLEEESKTSSDRNAGNLAHHYYQAGEMNPAFYWSVEAGAVAYQHFAFDQAKKFFDWAARALNVLKETKQPLTSQLLSKYYSTHGQLKTAFGDYEAATELLRNAQVIYQEMGEKYKEAELLLSMANCLKLATSVSEALKAYNTALGMARELNAPQLKWASAFGAARCEAEIGNPELASDLIREGLFILEEQLEKAPEAEHDFMLSSGAEMEALLEELKNRMEKTEAHRQSGSYAPLETQLCQSSTPDTGSRVIEITSPQKEIFKRYALLFKQLHSTNEILNKLSKTQLSPPRVVGLIFSGLKQLKGRLDDLDPVVVNSHLSVLEKQLHEYSSWLQMVNETLPPYTMRRYLEDNMLSQEEMLQLARFMVVIQSEARDDKGKAELLITHALTLEVDRRQIIAGLFSLDTVYNPLGSDHPKLQLLESILEELDSVKTYTEFITRNLTQRIKQAKADFGQLFWHPQILTMVIEIDLRIDLRLRELLELEQREIGTICDKLLKLGIKMLPRRGPAGALDVDAAKRMVERANDLLKTNYESNLSGLMMLAEVGRYLRAYLEEQGILITGEQQLLNPFVDVDSAIPTQATKRALPPADTTISSSTASAPTVNPSQFRHSSDKHYIPPPFVGGTAEAASPTTYGRAGVIGEQVEMKLQSRLAEICILLATKLRDAPVKVLQLKRSQLAIASWEVDALLSSEDDPEAPSVNKQNYLIRRSIALLAEMQEVGISCRELLTAGKRTEAQNALAMAECFLDQARMVTNELETYSHRERDVSEYTRAQNLAATRQKLVSTQQLLNTLVSWLKREMEK